MTGQSNLIRKTRFSGANGDRRLIYPVQLATNRMGSRILFMPNLLKVITTETRTHVLVRHLTSFPALPLPLMAVGRTTFSLKYPRASEVTKSRLRMGRRSLLLLLLKNGPLMVVKGGWVVGSWTRSTQLGATAKATLVGEKI